MSTTLDRPAPATYTPATSAPAGAVPWPLAAVATASTFVIAGIIWDISWHMTIGRDSFWTPAHLCTYLAGLIVGVTCGYVALRTTFRGTPDERAHGVRFWGFTAPLGAWICVWGAFAMLTSAPFDDWWHNAYGLDVKIISPPHTVLALGLIAIVVGAMVWTLAAQNDPASRVPRKPLERLFLYNAGIAIGMAAIFVYENTYRGFMHDSSFYKVTALAFPGFLVAVARSGGGRWPATTAAVVYMVIRILAGWILPLFPAEPKLGPIYHPMERMAAMEFPILLVAPAIAIDLLAGRLGRHGSARRDWLTAPIYGAAFVLALLIVQWPFADFLHSPLARNWLFFTDENFSYGTRHASSYFQFRYFTRGLDGDAAQFVTGIAVACLYAAVMARFGLAWGRWMARIRR